jgi:hypothetical protein
LCPNELSLPLQERFQRKQLFGVGSFMLVLWLLVSFAVLWSFYSVTASPAGGSLSLLLQRK